MLRYLCQGVLVPGFVLLLVCLLLGRAVPVADYAGPDRETILKEQLEQAQRIQADVYYAHPLDKISEGLGNPPPSRVQFNVTVNL